MILKKNVDCLGKLGKKCQYHVCLIDRTRLEKKRKKYTFKAKIFNFKVKVKKKEHNKMCNFVREVQ